MAKTVEMTEVTVSSLIPYERNAKKHPEEQIEKIKKSIQEFGFISPCLIDKNNRIIACEQMNRKCNIMEYDEFYASAIIKRWEDETGEKAEKIND